MLSLVLFASFGGKNVNIALKSIKRFKILYFRSLLDIFVCFFPCNLSAHLSGCKTDKMEDEPSCSTNIYEPQVDSASTNVNKLKRGGINCCVPHCTNNSLKNSGISFHKIPKDEVLRKKWVKLLKTKGLRDIGPNYRVCSSRFPGGKKTYLNNIPTELATPTLLKTRRQLFRPEVKTLEKCEDKALRLNIKESEPAESEIVEIS